MTVRVTFFVPPVVYVWEGFAPVPVVPSPKFHRYEEMVPSGSDDPALEKDTGLPVEPEYGPLAWATGGSLTAVTVMETVAVFE